MSELKERHPRILVVRENQMVFSVPSQEEGIEEIVYVDDAEDNHNVDAPINLGGALANLVDGDAMLAALDAAGHESRPTPPITSIG